MSVCVAAGTSRLSTNVVTSYRSLCGSFGEPSVEAALVRESMFVPSGTIIVKGGGGGKALEEREEMVFFSLPSVRVIIKLRRIISSWYFY